jgi:hypothetical protein
MNTILVVIMLLSQLEGEEISGRISNQFGEPIAEAKACTDSWLCTKSDKDGIFRIKKILHQEMIWFSRSGYKPLLMTITGSKMNIVLEKAGFRESEWVLSWCPPIEKKGRYIGDNLNVFVPKAIRIYESTGADYWMVAILHGPEKERLTFGSGPTWTHGFPDWAKTLPDLVSREVIIGDPSDNESYSHEAVASDVRGRSKDGKFWRFTGDCFEALEYEGVTKEDAEEFDKIIDTLCDPRPAALPHRPIPLLGNE